MNAYVVYLCTAIPLILLFGILDKKSRLIILYVLIGMSVCMIARIINSKIAFFIPGVTIRTLPYTYSPIIEEILKAFFVLIYGFAFSDDKRRLLSISLACGIGFGIMENTTMTLTIGNPDLIWALFRGFGTALMHGIATMIIGNGISYIRKSRKLFFTGTISLLSVSIIYHASYNCLVSSKYQAIGLAIPIIIYIFVLSTDRFKDKKRNSIT